MSKFKVGDLVCTQTDLNPGIRQGAPYVVSGCRGGHVKFVDDDGWLRARPADRYTLYKTPEEHADDEFRETTFAPLDHPVAGSQVEAALQVAMGESDPTGRDPHEPGAKLDAGKAEMGLIFNGMPRALLQVARVGTYGANKYTRDGWLTVPDGQRRYTDAMYRHLNAEARGEVHDADTQLEHAAHTAWNALARLELLLRGEGANT